MATQRPRLRTSGSSAARTLGKLGGRKGGPARAKALSGGKREDIARHAAKKRWGKSSSYAKPAYYKRKTSAYPARP